MLLASVVLNLLFDLAGQDYCLEFTGITVRDKGDYKTDGNIP